MSLSGSRALSLPKITFGRIGDAARPERGWCVKPGACELDCNTPHMRQGSVSDASRPTTAMTHIAIQEALNGKPVDWMEKVTDTQYGK